MKLEDFTTFLKVAELGSFNRAAFLLGVAKSVASMRVRRLEQDLGTRLLDRTTRGVSLTEAGHAVAARCRAALRELDAARAIAVTEPGALVGEISLTASLSFGTKFIAPAIGDFLARHPRLSCTAHYSDDCADLASGRHDVALRISYVTPNWRPARIIARLRHHVVASPDLIEALGVPATPGDLQSLPCLIYWGVGELDRWQFRGDAKTMSVHVRGRVHANIIEALLCSCLAGRGFAYLPDFFVEEEIAAGHLVRVLANYDTPEMVVHPVYPPGGGAPRKVTDFVDFLCERFQPLNRG